MFISFSKYNRQLFICVFFLVYLVADGQTLSLKQIVVPDTADYNDPTYYKPVLSQNESLQNSFRMNGTFTKNINIKKAKIDSLELDLSVISPLEFDTTTFDYLRIRNVQVIKRESVVQIIGDDHPSMIMDGCNISNLEVYDSYLDSALAEGYHYRVYDFRNTHVNLLTFENFEESDGQKPSLTCNFYGGTIDSIFFTRGDRIIFNFVNCQIKYIDLSYYTPKALLNLNNIIAGKSKESTCRITFGDENLYNLDFDFQHFDIDDNLDTLHNEDSYKFTLALLNNIIELQKKKGYLEGQQKAEIQKRDFILLHNFSFKEYLSKVWWRYGYKQEYILKWTSLFFLLFFIFNIFFGSYLSKNVYCIESVKEYLDINPNDAKRNYLFLFPGALLYTVIIFFGIKLDMDKFILKKTFGSVVGMLYLLIFYGIGLFCIAFLGKYLLEL